MCGIAAIIGKIENLKTNLLKSLDRIKHRGNSPYEFRILTNAALGANRLAIVDRNLGIQPQSNEDNSIFAVQNGEIYNYKKLKNELEKQGHNFKTDCDTEVLVHLYEQHGPKFVSMLDSEMFAFCIYNSKTGDYLIARDPVGVKPLYYAYDNSSVLYVGSEIKQLSQFQNINEVHEFPPGNYLYNGKFTQYFQLETKDRYKNKTLVKRKLKKLVEESVHKRVQTDLPIGVFLSGGVDSSLIMKLAAKYHKNVTALILGNPGSSDLETAVRFCQEFNYKHKVVYPNPNYEKEVADLIYYLESYEPLIIRQSFANNIISQAAAKMGIKIVLTGEAVDELFAGYNEFSHLTEKNINKGCELLLRSLSRGHHMRVDKMAMRHTVETRSPFFDNELIKFALQIDGKLKINKKDHRITTKTIWREMASDYLPDYIAYRFKAPFANGAGMDIGFNYRSEDGELAKIAKEKISNVVFEQVKRDNPEYKFSTREECHYFNFYKNFGYNKYQDGRIRLVVKDNLSDLEDDSSGTRLLVAEFDRLPMYFPAYLASDLGYFKKYSLNVDFIATGGDDKTYTSLIQNSAQIGMADPMFAMIDNPFAIKGEILGSLLNLPPLYAVTFNKDIEVDSIEDLKRYNIATYEKYSTTNTITQVLLKGHPIKEVHHSQIQEEMKNGCADIAIISCELALNLVGEGARVIYSIKNIVPHLLFAGFTVAQNLEDKYKKVLPKFLQAVQDAINFINKNPDKTYSIFKKEFKLSNSKKIFQEYSGYWQKDLRYGQADWDKAVYFWRTAYPKLLSEVNPYYTRRGKEEIVFDILVQRKYSRCHPYKEFEMLGLIKDCIATNSSIPLVGFWGASDKNQIDEMDIKAIERLAELDNNIKSVYEPGLNFTFILADKHAEQNGYKKENYQTYLGQIKKVLIDHGWSCIFLSDLWGRYSITTKNIEDDVKNQPFGWWSKVEIKNKLLKQASKHSLNKSIENGAKSYYLMREKESKVLDKEYSKFIFWTYSDNDMQEVYPDLPTLYLYSIRKNIGITPWFHIL